MYLFIKIGYFPLIKAIEQVKTLNPSKKKMYEATETLIYQYLPIGILKKLLTSKQKNNSIFKQNKNIML
jgi:hypothetical protein